MSELAPRSYNEMRFYVTRAAIGAGLPYALAECLGTWAMRLAAEGIEPSRACASVLIHLTNDLVDQGCGAMQQLGQNSSDSRKTRSVVYVAPVVCDWINVSLSGQHVQDTYVVERIDCPELLIAAIADECGSAPCVDIACSKADHRITVQVSLGSVETIALKSIADLSFHDRPGFWQVQVQVRTESDVLNLEPPNWKSAYAKGIDVHCHSWPVLESFFSRSLVPSSGQSVLAGAGAGLQDND